MEKQKKWQRYLILAVVALTIYNILPTVFFYSNPLKKPIDQKRSEAIVQAMTKRTNQLEQNAVDWLSSFCALVNVKPLSINLNPKEPQLVQLTFKSSEEANQFKHYLPRAGALIPNISEQLSLYSDPQDLASKQVVVERRIPIHFEPAQTNSTFQFSSKFDAKGAPTPLYRALVSDRALQVGLAAGGVSENAHLLQLAVSQKNEGDLVYTIAQNILSFVKTFGENSALSQRYFASFTQIDEGAKEALLTSFVQTLDAAKSALHTERTKLQEEAKAKQAQSTFLDAVKQQSLDQLTAREKTLTSAEAIIKRQFKQMASGKTPLNYTSLGALLQESTQQMGVSKLQTFSLDGRHPFIERITIDWSNQKISLLVYPDVATTKNGTLVAKDLVDQFLYNEIASISRLSSEKISPFQDQFQIELSALPGSKSFVAMRLSSIASTGVQHVKQALLNSWAPKHPDLSADAFPIMDFETYQNLPPEKQKLGLIIYAPVLYGKMPQSGFRMNSIYVIAKGMDKILQKVKAAPDSEMSKQFLQDFQKLRGLLQKSAFLGYSGSSYGLDPAYTNDFIFEAEDYFQSVVKATRENFQVHGTKRYAVLEFTDVEQRILTENRIETAMHEELLKWRDDYNAAQLSIKGASKYDVPKPTTNILLSNLKLSFAKYFRGDDRKILHWGLDLSGGKTVLIELRDTAGRLVTDEIDIKQGINELYNRVNKMGVSEVSIRQEGDYIALDFPGSQGLSAAELVKASSMYFHVVNEKFSPNNPALAAVTDRFLSEVWNEAVVTNRKEADDLNLIAWKHLYGDSLDPNIVQPRSEAAKTLFDSGLRFALQDDVSGSAFNDSYSKVAVFRGADFTDWHGQTHPLLLVFRHYALEGSNLDNVQASYDPSKGNFLSFGVKGSQAGKDKQRYSPRDDLFAWTSQFSKEKIAGTPNAAYSRERGWRMAVILNGSVINAPTLDSPLRDSAMITGSFSQREVKQLEADLKAGSLSFTPRILSEKNVSPELGGHERFLGILAMFVAMLLVILVMIGYYRFSGVVASAAVLFNLLMMWAALQNINATLTLANIAGIILTLGMAVDANVLVFERIREEFAITGRIASAIHAGYKKAFSAILDSNVTTIIAALILLQFDAGPIKGFAITLIIGIVSSMFTALFMTRTFFAAWAQKPEHKELKMCQFIKATHFNFLKHAKMAIWLSTAVIVVGGALFIAQRHTLLGMDFTGGYALSVEVTPSSTENYRAAVEKALVDSGVNRQEIQVRELNPKNSLRLFLSKSLDQPGHPFYGMPLQTEMKNLPYESNPKIVWIVQALQKAGVQIEPQSLTSLEKGWSQISGQMSETMRNQAFFGLTIALLCILIYITVRFEFKYAISATLCLAHDVIFTVAAIAILYALNVPVQIDLNTVAALMTIVGYSLNDTIIVFDRIREDVQTMKKMTFTDIINQALNTTLSRTIMTSGTTLVALIPLVCLGKSTIFGFALVMIIGVVFGTLSSLFIASPLMTYFHKREIERKQKLISSAQ